MYSTFPYLDTWPTVPSSIKRHIYKKQIHKNITTCRSCCSMADFDKQYLTLNFHLSGSPKSLKYILVCQLPFRIINLCTWVGNILLKEEFTVNGYSKLAQHICYLFTLNWRNYYTNFDKNHCNVNKKARRKKHLAWGVYFCWLNES